MCVQNHTTSYRETNQKGRCHVTYVRSLYIFGTPVSFRHSQWGNPGMTPSSTISAKLQHWRIVVWGTPEGTLKLGQMALVPTDVPLLFMAVVDHCRSLSTSNLLVKVGLRILLCSTTFHSFSTAFCGFTCVFWIHLQSAG